MLKKVALVLGVIGLGFAFGTSATIIYAHVVPGVDRPFDPANYYSLDTVSTADSAPSTFALRDLAAQGGQVYDHSRHLKSIEAAEKFLSQLSTLLGQNTLVENNTVSLDTSTLKELDNNYESTINAITSANVKIDSTPTPFKRDISDGYSNLDTSMRHAEQATYLNDKYKAIATAAQSQLASGASLSNSVITAVEASDNAIGEKQATQAKTHLLALNNASNMQTQELLNMLTQLKQLDSLQKADDATLIAAHELGSGLHVFDPYNDFEKEMIDSYYNYFGIEKYESKPMPNFN